MFDWLRLAGVLSRARDLRAGSDPRCRIEKDVLSNNGWRLDRFVPRSPSGASLLLLHGWTLRGKDDLRLQAFARSLAIAGVECLVPHVPGLANLTFDHNDVHGVRAILNACATAPGIVGFSIGGAYALLAASGGTDRPRFVASVGSYADLTETFRRTMSWGRKTPSVPTEHEAWIYQKLAVAWRLRDVIPLPSSVQHELCGLLEAFCETEDLEVAWQFCQRVLGDTDWESVDEQRQDASILRELSPVEHPPRLCCPAIILHGKDDPTMPPDEAAHLADAIRRGSPNSRVDMMVTDLLHHVHASAAFRPAEVLRLLRLLSPLVQQVG